MADAPGPVFVAMCGIPFSGKSTVARDLADRCGWSLVSVDAIVAELDVDLGLDAGNQQGWARAMAEGFRRSRELLATGASVIYDNASHSRRNRDRCRRVAVQGGARFRLIWLDTPVDEAHRRQVANRASPIREDVPDTSFREIVGQFEPPLDEPDVIRVMPDMKIETVIEQIG